VEEKRMNEDTSEEIKTLLEDIKALLLLANQDKLEEMRKKLLRNGSIESQVYELCDGVNTTQDIANKIQKAQEYAGAVISKLRRKGLVKTVEREGKKVHEQRF
jgi:cell division septum initiation protein DivIVA